MKPQQGYLVPCLRGNAIRSWDGKPKPVEFTTGKKYFTLTGGRMLKFAKEPKTDQNSNTCHIQHSDYTPDYWLYETEDAALAFIERMSLINKIHAQNVTHKISLMSNAQLQTILETLEAVSTSKKEDIE